MSKKMMALGLAVACAALFALPAAASAQVWHLSETVGFTVTGSGGTMTTTEGASVQCTSTTGSGSFSTTTSGFLSLTFHGCTGPFGFACTTAGQSSGTIALSNSFNGIMVTSTASTKDPGVLLTPTGSTEPTAGKGKQFTEFSCLGISVKVAGNGIIGTIHNPEPPCGATASTWGVNFVSASAGHQADKVWTGVTYDAYSTVTASHPTASLDGTATLHFEAARTLNCT